MTNDEIDGRRGHMSNDELREIASRATPGPWREQEPYGVIADGGNICGMWDGLQTSDSMHANQEHIAAWNPSRALAALGVIEAAEVIWRLAKWSDANNEAGDASLRFRAALRAWEGA